MMYYVFRRLLRVAPVFVGVTLLSFGLIHVIPGDPVEVLMGERGVSPALHAQAMQILGLDKPLLEQYFQYIWGVLHGDLGTSIVTGTSVFSEFMARFPATIELSMCAMLFAVIVGIPAGIAASLRRGTTIDQGVMGVSLTGYSLPVFWWGLILIMIFSVKFGWTPVSGRIAIEYDIPHVTGLMLIDSMLASDNGAFGSAISHLVLPTIVLGTAPLAVMARMTRSAMLEVLREDYLRTARAKGLSPTRVVLIHALRNALIPVITVLGLQVGSLLSGAVITETLFSWPGIGKWLIDAIGRRDYPVVQGGILLIATMVISVNLLVDLLYGLLNPRIRHAR